MAVVTSRPTPAVRHRRMGRMGPMWHGEKPVTRHLHYIMATRPPFAFQYIIQYIIPFIQQINLIVININYNSELSH